MEESSYEKALKRGLRSDLLQRDLCCIGIKLRILQIFQLSLFLILVQDVGRLSEVSADLSPFRKVYLFRDFQVGGDFEVWKGFGT